MRFTKRPVTIEAFQMTRERRMDNSEWPSWLNEAWNKEAGSPGRVFIHTPEAPMPNRLCIGTLEGVMLVDWDDWIIRGVNGELYPCKPDIFELTYMAGENPMPQLVLSLEYAIKEADGWHDECRSGEVWTPEMMLARCILREGKKWLR